MRAFDNPNNTMLADQLRLFIDVDQWRQEMDSGQLLAK